MKILRAIRWLLFLALLGAFAMFVWPTRFRYDHMTVDGNLVPVRIDRFDGNSDMLVPDQGWVPVEGQDADPGTAPAAATRHRAQRAHRAGTAPAANPL